MRLRHTINRCVVSTHAPVKARHRPWSAGGQPTTRFNPRAREGATRRSPHIRKHSIVSTHAPVKARRSHLVAALPGVVVSTHAPVKARLGKAVEKSLGAEFQPTRP